MSTKWLGIYCGYFLAMLALALFVTGVFQRGILPRLWGQATAEAPISEKAGGAGDERSPAIEGPETAGKPGSAPTGDQPPASGGASSDAAAARPSGSSGSGRGSPALDPQGPAPNSNQRPAKESLGDKTAQVKRLARVYEGMRPKEAASVIEKLERPLAVELLSEIKERQAAKILGAMNPASAAEISRQLGQGPGGISP